MTAVTGPVPSRPRRAAPPPDIIDEQTAILRMDKIKKLVTIQAWIIGSLALVLLVALPFVQPVYLYYAMKPDGQVMRMVGLDMPNMTNRAVLSWAATSISEIMTMGFGDMDVKLPHERVRFTKQGWEAYNTAFVQQEVGEKFKQSQMVLTTVPSNTPVIVSQGTNLDNVYEWHVQMPVIMTYANTTVVRQRAIVRLTIIRVPAEDSAAGIAIQNWDMSN
ncbi:MAG: DotI/IcmL/TraM family protein [Alphaproteobacteria bacterium]|nr:DotI/IcmL/TraM family protein [Alphaproteobacteria bacterium]